MEVPDHIKSFPDKNPHLGRRTRPCPNRRDSLNYSEIINITNDSLGSSSLREYLTLRVQTALSFLSRCLGFVCATMYHNTHKPPCPFPLGIPCCDACPVSRFNVLREYLQACRTNKTNTPCASNVCFWVCSAWLRFELRAVSTGCDVVLYGTSRTKCFTRVRKLFARVSLARDNVSSW